MTTRLLIKVGALFIALTCLAGCGISPQNPKWRDKSDALLNIQEATASHMNAVGNTKRVFYAAFALHSGSTAFQGDAILVRDILHSLNPRLSILLLSNQHELSDINYPFAIKKNMNRVLTNIAGLSNQNSLVVVLLASHGAPNKIRIKIGNGGYSVDLTSQEVKRYLEQLESIPTIILISACYSGSFMTELAGENRIIITSASKDRVSFGCSPKGKNTYFIRELFQNNFNASKSLSELFLQASQQVAEKEKRNNLSASQPQMYVGERMKTIVTVPLNELITKI
ncbi:MAG: C13 family peptidase [Proteobacteria bacterium]|nr:C13 family peptidase [Pseudomonadota bacterium]MBU1583657.1 C13 family peptidase [Pseudomonadota bacterium]MBU2453378.1 C13 family peptidase [Pseudomonadota bacterium]